MDFKEFPVLDTLDFEAVTIDATQWSNNTYSLMLNFWKVLPKASDEQDSRKAEGLIICTHMGGESLREAYTKFEMLFASGFLAGVAVHPNGYLWDEDGNIIAELSWDQFDDSEEYDDSILKSIDSIDYHKSPTLLQ
jgi:hypothetical protein